METKIRIPGNGIKWCIFTLFLVLLSACSGPEGPEGPPGPRGPGGSDGIDGINYTGSAIYEVLPAGWAGGINGYVATLEVPEINNDIYYDGAVLVYRLHETEPKSFNMLPYTYIDNEYSVYMDFDVYIGSIDITYKETIEMINTTARPSGLMVFKVVVIRGVPLAVLKSKVNVANYNEVVNYLNLGQENNTQAK